jgi:Spy/CpxP family protein refolding chaperone
MMFMANIRRAVLAGCVLGAACVAATLPAQAQDAALPKTQAEFEKQIGLTADQKKKMDAVQKKYQPQLLAIGKKYQPEFQKMQQQMQELQGKMQALNQKAQTEAKPLMEKAQKESNAILTPAQQKKIKEFQDKAKQQAAMQGGLMGGAPPR